LLLPTDMTASSDCGLLIRLSENRNKSLSYPGSVSTQPKLVQSYK
jgi:hypothetical protein